MVFLANLDPNPEIYLYYRAFIVYLKDNGAFILIFFKYIDFINVFTKSLIAELPKYIKISNYAINQVKG